MDTCIIRRIDDLGRVVIPKEIRKTLRIKEGDPLEFYIEKENVILKKHSPITALGEYSFVIADGIAKVTGKSCIITDTDKVVLVGGKDKSLENKLLSDKMISVLKERKSLLIACGDGAEPIPITKSDNGAENQIIVPIVGSGDCFGAIVLYDNDKTSRFNSADVKLVRLSSYILSERFE